MMADGYRPVCERHTRDYMDTECLHIKNTAGETRRCWRPVSLPMLLKDVF